MKVDSEWTIDAIERAKDTTSFSPVHMNHSSSRSNISRRCCRADQTISCYAATDIEAPPPPSQPPPPPQSNRCRCCKLHAGKGGGSVSDTIKFERYEDSREYLLSHATQPRVVCSVSISQYTTNAKSPTELKTCRCLLGVYLQSRYDLQVGQELLLDYGALYWRGREHLVVD